MSSSATRAINGTPSNGLESTNTGGLRFGPLEISLRKPMSQLSSASDAIKTISQVLENFTAEVEYVKDNYQTDKEKDKMIDELNIALRNITLIRSEETENLQVDVRKLEARVAASDKEKEKYEELVKELETTTVQNGIKNDELLASHRAALDREYREKETKLRNELAKERERIERENRKKLKDLNSQKETALKEVERLKDELKAEQEKLAEKKERHRHERTGLHNINRELSEQLSKYKADFAVDDVPSGDCAGRFRNLSNKIHEVASSYSKMLLLGNQEDSENLRYRLSELDPVFKWTPISESRDSKSLRTPDIEHIILKCICEVAWQPFSSEVVSNCKNARDLLSQVSDQLSKISGNVESTWRTLTLRGLDKLDTGSSETAVDTILTKIRRTLEPLGPANLDTQKMELAGIARDAVDLWKEIERGRCRVVVETKPNKEDTTGWESACQTEPSSDTPYHDEKDLEDILVFPKIRWIEPDGSDSTTLIPGRAIFADSPTLARGIIERNTIQDEIQEARDRKETEETTRKLQEMLRELNSPRKPGRHSRNTSTVTPPNSTIPGEGLGISGAFGAIPIRVGN
ncbi:hypothetical protein GP486_001225 [Trichoglossum hirsutum]|uniref:Uncharacterized protein n=1 Tax=Trichoglossum hirsutum TaxID=265104 RepID=A0A9P8LH89_9PEZI|nr:hypothetical protein GP486_001225 [Trichoglossum hirsutum]